VLSLAKPGKLGPNMTPAAPDCVKWRIEGGRIPGGCDVSGRRGRGAGGLTIPAGTIDDLITALASSALLGMPGVIDRPIVDRTGLSGYFDMVGPSAFAGARGGGDPDTNGSFFTLMREQLGLKFSPARETVDVLVIDSASLPDPN
jgi:uncharacterized protein (TIGR03435 family)